jgi:hypothetical protein
VVIGDLDVPGAQAVVSTITKDGGCVIFDCLPDATRLRVPVPVFHPRKAVATKCNVVSWDDQLSLFELAFEKYGAVDIVVRILLSTISPRFYTHADDDRSQTQESLKMNPVCVREISNSWMASPSRPSWRPWRST